MCSNLSTVQAQKAQWDFVVANQSALITSAARLESSWMPDHCTHNPRRQPAHRKDNLTSNLKDYQHHVGLVIVVEMTEVSALCLLALHNAMSKVSFVRPKKIEQMEVIVQRYGLLHILKSLTPATLACYAHLRYQKCGQICNPDVKQFPKNSGDSRFCDPQESETCHIFQPFIH